MGLSLSKSFAFNLGIDLLFDADYKEGSKFSLVVPKEKFLLERKSEKFSNLSSQNCEKKHSSNSNKSNNFIDDEKKIMLKNKYTVNFVENADNFWVSTKGISRKMNSFFKNNCESKLKNESKNMKLKLKKSFPEKDNILSYDSDISINEEKKFVSFKKQNKRKSKLQSNKTKLPSYFLNKDLLSMNSQKTEKDKDFWTKKITKDVKIKNKKCFTFLESKNTSQKMSFREINDKNKRNVGNESDFGNGIDPLDEYNINDSKSVTTKSFRMSYKINYSENKISDLINLKVINY